MESPHAATRQTAQTPPAANTARHPNHPTLDPWHVRPAAPAGGAETRRSDGCALAGWLGIGYT